MTITFSSTTEALVNGWHVLERERGDGEYEIALVTDAETIKHISRGATRDLCIIGLRNSGYTVNE